MKQAINKTAPAKAQASNTSLTLKQISEYDLKTELTRCIGIHRLTKNQIINRFELDSTPELVISALFYLVAGGTAYVLGGRYFLTSGGCRPHTDGKPQTETKPAAHTPTHDELVSALSGLLEEVQDLIDHGVCKDGKRMDVFFDAVTVALARAALNGGAK